MEIEFVKGKQKKFEKNIFKKGEEVGIAQLYIKR